MKDGSTKETDTQYEFILFAWLLTKQDYVRKSRVEYFKNLQENGMTYPSIKVAIYDECNYLVKDGNHRARASWERGEYGVMAEIIHSRYRTLGKPKRIKDLIVEDF